MMSTDERTNQIAHDWASGHFASPEDAPREIGYLVSRIEALEAVLASARHELIAVGNLFASDQQPCGDQGFVIDTENIINAIDAVMPFKDAPR